MAVSFAGLWRLPPEPGQDVVAGIRRLAHRPRDQPRDHAAMRRPNPRHQEASQGFIPDALTADRSGWAGTLRRAHGLAL